MYYFAHPKAINKQQSIYQRGQNETVVVTLYDIDGSQVYKGRYAVGPMGETLIDVRELSSAASSGIIEIPDDGYIYCRVSLKSSAGGVAEFLN